MRVLLRLLALLILILGALSAVRRVAAALTPSRPQVPGNDEGHLVKDPVCGTYVPQATAVTDGTEYFCSEDCRRKYLAKNSRR